MNWTAINDVKNLEEALQSSYKKPIMLFKHSTRCSISSMALSRMERSWNDKEMVDIQPCYIDLIAHRDVSNTVAEKLGVAHQSPQVLLIKDGKCVYHDSHMNISYQNIKNQLGAVA